MKQVEMSDNTDRVALIVQRYERRLANNKKWAKFYYENHTKEILIKQLLSRVKIGKCPSTKTVERLNVDKQTLKDAWLSYTADKKELTEQAQKFHRYITGEEWVYI